jgi:predicted phage terminase large subunit-like protein
VRAGWHIVEPGTPLEWNWHIEAICLHLEAITRGTIKRLLINIPPGHAKSLLVSVFWPAWVWIDNPHWRALFASYDINLALRDSVRTRDLLDSEWYRRAFRPKWKMHRAQNGKSYFVNSVQGTRYALSVRGKATGWRGDCVVVDDPLNVRDQYSKKVKEHCLFWWDKVMSSRLNDQRTGSRVIIMQRLAEDDLSGHMIKRAEYEHICLPSEFDTGRRSRTSIGWEDPRTAAGELLFPEKYPLEVLQRIKTLELGSEAYAGQHQQHPTPEGGGRFKREWFRYWQSLGSDLVRLFKKDGRTELIKLGQCSIFATQDVADSLEKSADYTVIAVWAVTPSCDILLLERIRSRMDDPEAVRAVVNLRNTWDLRRLPIQFVGTEANGVGLPRVQNMRLQGIPVRQIHVHRDKISRSTTAVIYCEAGQLFWPDPATTPWLSEWEAEHVMFPFGQYDDQVDTTSLAAAEVARGLFTPPQRGVTIPLESRPLFASRGRSRRRGVDPD